MNINKIQIEKGCEKDFEEIDHLLKLPHLLLLLIRFIK